jgi:putative transposase
LLFDRRKIRILTILDIRTRLSPALDARFSDKGANVAATLDRAAAEYGRPKTIRVDNGPEFVSKELDLWAFMRGVTLDFSRPGKPTDNAFIETFNRKFQAERLNANWFLSLDEARRKCETWRRDYNEARPHGAIGGKTPKEADPAGDTPASLPPDKAGFPGPARSGVGANSPPSVKKHF